MILIQELSLENYRNIKTLDLKNLKHLNILVGPSDCGKTNLLRAIEYASKLQYGHKSLLCKECENKADQIESAGLLVSPDDSYLRKDSISIKIQFNEKELEKLKIPRKRIRKEAYGEIKDIIKYPDFPKEIAEKTFNIKVHIGNEIKEIPAIATESVLVSLERANLKPPSKCRSGECGFCRSLLVSGKVFVAPVGDGRRAADKKFNFIHPCYSYPLTDLEIIVPRDI